MSKIDKLSILGIRSFDNVRAERIQFSTPLTLIVGANGSGKTTIIECLRYATTGDLPPNSKGGAFIHEPKLCGEKEILAQVKLSFKASGGARMVATRSLQLTVKKQTRQQKSLESQLLMLKNGERTAISSRVSELDALMPQYLGVSKAILDNVIFCHQDDSLWPLSEPAVLKKKFDEIFEAMKYTKAIDNIKAIRKKQNEELGKFKLLEAQYKTDKERADKIEGKSSVLATEIERLREDNRGLATKIRETLEATDDFWRQAKSFEGVIGELSGLRIMAQTKQESVDDLRTHIMEMEEDDEWLKTTLDKYEERMHLLRDGIREQERRSYALRVEVDESRHELGQRQTEAGRLKADEEQHMRYLERRETLVKETAHMHGMRGYDQGLDKTRIQEFIQKLNRLTRDKNFQLDKVKQENRDELQVIQTDLNQFEAKKSALRLTAEQTKRSITDSQGKIGQLSADIRNIVVDDARMHDLKSEETTLQDRLRIAKVAFADADFDAKIKDTHERVRNIEQMSQKLNAELIQSTREAGDHARLDFLQGEIKTKQRSLQSLVRIHTDKIGQTIGSGWEARTAERDLQLQIEQRKSELSDAHHQRDKVDRELNEIDFKVRSVKDQLSAKQTELVTCKSKLGAIIDDGEAVSSYPGVIELLQNNRDILSADVFNFKNMHAYFEGAVKAAEDPGVCRLCERSFREKEKSPFLKRLRSLLSQENLEKMQSDLLEAEESLNEARDAAPSYESWLKLEDNDIPALRNETNALQVKRNEASSSVDLRDDLVKEKTEVVQDAESLVKSVQQISKLAAEISDFESQIEQLSALEGRPGASRTLDHIQQEIAQLGDQARDLRMTAHQSTNEKDIRRGQINILELDVRDATAQLKDASNKLERKSDFQKRVEELQAAIESHSENKRRAEAEMEGLLPQVDQAQARYDDVVSRGVDKERAAQQEASRLTNSVQQLQTIEQDIEAYEHRGGSERLEVCEREISQYEDQIISLDAQQREILQEFNKVREQLEKNEETKRSIQDNLRYRRDVRALEESHQRIAELAAQNAEADRDNFVKHAEQSGRTYNNLSAQQASKMGLMKSKDDQLQRLIEDWETDYKDAAKNYRESKIRVEATKACIEDLGRYAGALDKAIMKFHSLKMEEINRIIEELWRRTYQGTDVDSILIRSDNESPAGTAGAAKTGNRTYNYRVCMLKSGIEMDMRGRCSSGQKVLACIMIRLALAECFGTNCGLISLDEPTNQLDRDNIQSLAESLHDIIRLRRQQNNFQLIIITHDEDFLRAMQCGEFCDDYYRVRRDERQTSVIVKQSIAEVMA